VVLVTVVAVALVETELVITGDAFGAGSAKSDAKAEPKSAWVGALGSTRIFSSFSGT